ncbi:MAG TPA: oligosaccharide flippase family protein [Terracidiphilus sp.]|nr:oligosaccharide flippase family protein [Terracidiphilus sp.]
MKNTTQHGSALTMARNVTALAAGEIGVRALTTLGAVLIARSLGPGPYGTLSVALAFAAIAAYLTDIGLIDVTFKQLTRPNADVGLVLGTVSKTRVALTAASVLGSVLIILHQHAGAQHRWVMLAVVVPSICGMAMQGFSSSYFLAIQQMHVTAALRVASQLVVGASLVAAWFLRWPVERVALVYGISSLAGGLLCLQLVRRHAAPMRGWSPALLKGLSAFTLGGIGTVLLPQMGLLILERVASAAEVGYFAAASRIPVVLYAIPGCIATAWYPQMFQAGSSDPARHFRLCLSQLKINGILGFGLSLPIALNSRLVIGTLLGRAWEGPAATVLSTLCWMVMLNSITIPLADALTTTGLQTRRAALYGIAVLAGAVLLTHLGSSGGAAGAAAAALLTQAVLSAALLAANPSGFRLLTASARQLIVPLALGSAAAAAIRLALSVNLVTALLGALAFFVMAAVPDAEIRTTLIRMIRRLASKSRTAIANA